MNFVENMKAEHLAEADQQWESAVERIKGLLAYKHDPKVRILAYHLLTMDRSSLFTMFGGDGRNDLCSYPHISSAHGCEFLHALAQFISYDILDDGDPGIGYLRHDDYTGFTPCAKDHEDAVPYFHRSVEYLRKTVPDALCLEVGRALEVCDFYTARQEERRVSWTKDMENEWLDEEDRKAFDPTPEEVQFKAFVDELCASIDLG